MRVQQLLKKLEKHHKKKIDLSLDRTFNLLNKLGNPQNKNISKNLRIFHQSTESVVTY